VKYSEKNYWSHIQIGLELACAVLAGFFLGYQADKKLGTSPWLLLAGTAFGMLAGFYLVIKEITKDDK
jgi:F0F1-type ATP synthase assembly protein I